MKKRLKKSRKILINEMARQLFRLKFIFICLFIISLPVLVEGAICTTIVPAGIVVNETWTVEGSPYCVTGDIQVSLLTIEPGVEVLVDGAYKIEVLSTITAVGTDEDPIIFTAVDPEVPWKGIKFQDAPPGSNFTHVIVEYSNDGGITLVNSSPPIIDNCTIQNNSRSGHGGGISAVGVTGDFALPNSTFSGNTSSQHGGALHISLNEGFELTITDALFENNTANPSHASGNYVGGALYLQNGDALILNSRFMSNRSNSRCSSVFSCNVTARGGAIYVGGSGNVEIRNSELVGNRTNARNNGNCFFGGYSKSFGGGIYVNAGTVTLDNNILSCNTTTRSSCGASDGGGGLYVNGGDVTVDNNTIARNADATGVQRAGGTLDIANSIIYYNNGDGTQVSGTATVTYSDIQGGMDGEGNISYNPVFAGTECEAGDLDIVPGSPAIDAGNPDASYNDECLPPGLGTDRNDMGVTGGPANCGSPLELPERNCFDGIDNDDDGLTDCEDEDCAGATNGSCNTGLFGICSTGIQTCSGGVEECVQNEQPIQEICDGVDNDCDGVLDGSENLTQQCGTTDVGECSFGTETCNDSGGWIGCNAVLPATEICDGLDNDCDGVQDGSENLTQQCGTTDVGECSFGTETCNDSGNWAGCDAVLPVTEICDDLDNDCDALIDEDFTDLGDECTNGLGVCERDGNMACKADGSGTECNAVPGQPTEEPEATCDDGLDNDCDGEVDNCLECDPTHWNAPDVSLVQMHLAGNFTIDSEEVGLCDEVAVFDSENHLIGHFVVKSEEKLGQYGDLVVSGDSLSTPDIDEGADEGELLTIKVWDDQNQRERINSNIHLVTPDTGIDPYEPYQPPLAFVADTWILMNIEVTPGCDIALESGWNLFGWTCDQGYYEGENPDPSEYATDSILVQVDSIEDAFNEIDPSGSNKHIAVGPDGKVYVSGLPFNNLNNLLPGWAYWKYADEDKTISLPGYVLDASSSLDLGTGWKQIAYWGDDGLAPEEAFTCINGKYDVIVNGDGKVYVKGSPFSTLGGIYQAEGYFIHMTESATLKYDCN